MFRENLIIVLVMLGFLWSGLARSQEGETVDSVASPPVELKIPKGFSLDGSKLTLPNGQTLENVSGLQEIGKLVLIVRQSEVVLYSASQKRYVDLPLPTPRVVVRQFRGNQWHSISSPLALSTDEYELTLVPFDAAASNDRKAGSRTAFIYFKGAENTGVGVYRYQAGQPTLEYLTAGASRVPGQFKSWSTYERDVRGLPKATEIRINMDWTEEPKPDCRHGFYYVKRISGGKDMLGCVFPPSPEQNAQRQAAALAKFKEAQEKLGRPLDLVPMPVGPDE
jgi:hypothetical protein